MAKIPELVRRETILKAAHRMAQLHGLDGFTRQQVATEAQCSTGCVSTYYDAEALRTAVLKYSVEVKDWKLMQHLVLGKYRGRLRIPAALKKQIIARAIN